MSIKIEATYIVIREGKMYDEKNLDEYVKNLKSNQVKNGAFNADYIIISYGKYKYDKLSNEDKKVIDKYKTDLIIRTKYSKKITIEKVTTELIFMLDDYEQPSGEYGLGDTWLDQKLDVLYVDIINC